MAVYFSSGAFGRITPEAMLEELREVPGVGLEFTAGLDHRENWEDCFEVWKSLGVPLLLHNYVPPPEVPFVLNLASENPGILESSMSMVRRALKISASVGAAFYSVHGGFAIDLQPAQLGDHASQCAGGSDPILAEMRFVKSVRSLATEAGSLGVRLLLENNVVSPHHVRAGSERALLFSTPDDIQRVMDELSDLPVGLLMDVGHAKVTAETLGFDAEEFFSRNGRSIGALHLSDNDGRSDANTAISESAWFRPHLAAHAGKAMVIEVYNLSADQRRSQQSYLESFLS